MEKKVEWWEVQRHSDPSSKTFGETRTDFPLSSSYHAVLQDSSKTRRSGRTGNSENRKRILSSRAQNVSHAAGPINNPVPPPKILTARKRTKNGILKAPTELWLV